MGKAEFSVEDLQSLQTSDFIRLFNYVKAVGKEIEEDKAFEILRDCAAERRVNGLEKTKINWI
jgi:hypothetical protein